MRKNDRISRVLLLITFFTCLEGFNSTKVLGEILPESDNHTLCKTGQTDQIKWSYCLDKPKQGVSEEVLYYFHGLQGNEKNWAMIKGILDFWSKNHLSSPNVVAVSFGNVWALAPKESSPESGQRMQLLKEVIIPQVEKDIAGKINRRMLMGLSMGGFNAIQMAFSYPDFFERVALLCPALSELGPEATEEQIQAYVRASGANEQWVRMGIRLQKSVFKDDKSWQLANPFIIAEKELNSHFPGLYVSIGKGDEFGFFLGSQKIVSAASRLGTPVQWFPVSGGHCAYDVPAAAQFLKGRSD